MCTDTQTDRKSLSFLFLTYKYILTDILRAGYLGAELVHHMTKLVKESLHLMVLEERRPTCPGFGEVSHHGCHCKPAFSIRPSAARLETKACCMAILSIPGGGEGSKCHEHEQVK